MKYVKPHKQMAMGKKVSRKSPSTKTGKSSLVHDNSKSLGKVKGNLYC